MVCCGQNGIAPLGQNRIMMSHCIGLKILKCNLCYLRMPISLTLFSRCTSLIVILETYYLVGLNNMHEECLFINVRYNTAISPVGPTTRYSYITNLQDRLLYTFL